MGLVEEVEAAIGGEPWAVEESQKLGLVGTVATLLRSRRPAVAAAACRIVEVCGHSMSWTYELGCRGGHRLLLRGCCGELGDEVAETAAAAAAVCQQNLFPGDSFPSRAMLEEEEVRRRLATVVAGKSRLADFPVRTLPARMTWQGATGFRIWGAASVLVDWIDSHPDVFAGNTVVEVGAGAGLPSLAAAHTRPALVAATDFLPDVVSNIARSVCLAHSHSRFVRDDAGGAALAPVVCAILDWNKLDGPRPDGAEAAHPGGGEVEVVEVLGAKVGVGWEEAVEVGCGSRATGYARTASPPPPQSAHASRSSASPPQWTQNVASHDALLAQRFDVVMCSDVVYSEESAFGVARSMRALLNEGGAWRARTRRACLSTRSPSPPHRHRVSVHRHLGASLRRRVLSRRRRRLRVDRS